MMDKVNQKKLKLMDHKLYFQCEYTVNNTVKYLKNVNKKLMHF